jgi:ubiquinone/menaquinone biosynthesis C-methylase UbiE
VSSVPLSFFDGLATRYDETWTNTPIGRIQRNAVWREVDCLVRPSDRILDLGCGTGEDALHFLQAGATVEAIDASSKMIEVARSKGVNARLRRVEQVGEMEGPYDLIFSNFGVLNCISDLSVLAEPLARITRPGGSLAICLMSRFCLWESVYFVLRGQFRKAARRWWGEAQASGSLRVFYPSLQNIERALLPHFRIRRDVGIGLAVPPSFVRGVPQGILNHLERLDARVATSRIGRAVGDHRLLICTRSSPVTSAQRTRRGLIYRNQGSTPRAVR